MKYLDQLLTFKLTAEYGTFAKAARDLHLSAAAVGKQIKSLEAQLGVQLFYRTTRRVLLTEFGEAFYEQCERILQEIQKARDLVIAFSGDAVGKLKIVSAIAFAEQHILPYIKEFLSLYPKVVLDIELADRVADIELEHVDLLCGLMAGLPPHYICRKFKEDDYVWCASPAYLKANGEPRTLANLECHSYITHSRRPNPDTIIHGKNKVHIQPKLALNDSSAMIKCAIAGVGVIKIHSQQVAETIKQGRLVEILKKYKQPAQPIYLYFKKSRYTQPKLRAFIDFLVSKFK